MKIEIITDAEREETKIVIYTKEVNDEVKCYSLACDDLTCSVTVKCLLVNEVARYGVVSADDESVEVNEVNDRCCRGLSCNDAVRALRCSDQRIVCRCVDLDINECSVDVVLIRHEVYNNRMYLVECNLELIFYKETKLNLWR